MEGEGEAVGEEFGFDLDLVNLSNSLFPPFLAVNNWNTFQIPLKLKFETSMSCSDRPHQVILVPVTESVLLLYFQLFCHSYVCIVVYE